MKLFKLIWLLIGVSYSLQAQKLSKMLEEATNTQKITLTSGDSVIIFHVVGEPKEIKPQKERFYWWYSGGKLKNTQGGYSGKLLNGTYLLQTSNKDILMEGNLKYGLKIGVWKSWYPQTGHLQSIESWKNGLLNGKVERFSEDGRTLLYKNYYKNGFLHGKNIDYSQDKKTITAFYIKGIQNGKFTELNAQDSTLTKGKYKNGLKNGWLYVYKQGKQSPIQKKFYKNGQEIILPQKVAKPVKKTIKLQEKVVKQEKLKKKEK
ncbi:hypothetical protein AD998_21175 [bacterium 336/3]|nr:hypothetical protein AD998_21175 [bacterium 336/3]